MKKVFAILGLVAIATGAGAQMKEKKNAFKVNLFSPIVKTGSVFYERKISPKSSLQLGVGYTGVGIDDVKLKGLFFTPEYRFYLSNNKEAMNGFYLAPFARYQNLTLQDKTDPNDVQKATLTSYGAGLLVGHQWMFGDIVTLDIFAGPRYISRKVKGDDVEVPGAFGSFGVRSGVTLGIAF